MPALFCTCQLPSFPLSSRTECTFHPILSCQMLEGQPLGKQTSRKSLRTRLWPHELNMLAKVIRAFCRLNDQHNPKESIPIGKVKAQRRKGSCNRTSHTVRPPNHPPGKDFPPPRGSLYVERYHCNGCLDQLGSIESGNICGRARKILGGIWLMINKR